MNQYQSQSESIIGQENESAQYQEQDDDEEEEEDDYEEQQNQSNQSQTGNKFEIPNITLNPSQRNNGNQSLKISINLGNTNNNNIQQQTYQKERSHHQSNKLENIQYMTSSRQTRRTFPPQQTIFTGKVKQRPQRKNRQSDDQHQAQRVSKYSSYQPYNQKLQKRMQNKKLMEEAKKAELKKILESISKKSQPKKARKQQTLKNKAQRYSNKLSSLHPLLKRINFEKHIIGRQKNTITFPVQLPPVLRQQQPLIERKGNLVGRVCELCQKDAKYYHKEGFSSCSLICYKQIKEKNQM